MAWVDITDEANWEPRRHVAVCDGLDCLSVSYSTGTPSVPNSYTFTAGEWVPPDLVDGAGGSTCFYDNSNLTTLEYQGDASAVVGVRITLEVLADFEVESGFPRSAVMMAFDPAFVSGEIDEPAYAYALGVLAAGTYTLGTQFIAEFMEDAGFNPSIILANVTGCFWQQDGDGCGPRVGEFLQIVKIETESVPVADFWQNFVGTEEI